MSKKNVSLFKKHNKIVRKYFKNDIPTFIWFIFDQIIFLIISILFILNLFSSLEQNITSYIIICGSFYLLLKFTYTNWTTKNKFFKKIFIFDYKLKLNNQKFRAQRSLEFIPIWFWICIIFYNFIIVVFINYEINNFLNNKIISKALLESMLNVMLIPSFLNSFQKLTQSDKKVESNYNNLIKNQYFSNESLFKDAKFVENYLNVEFKKNKLTSKKGLFIFINSKDLNEKDVLEIKKINEKILNEYSNLWSNYYELLEQNSVMKFSSKRNKRLFWIERIYDHIFLDFFKL
ncbi:hypothetical protein SDAV_003029 (plasmid) [Spiroplasma phoeniceum P40]|uniref:Uncharacterized protein n=2 Tax=Spiroplasma phoeniceum TaxID=47835 RepID=A0A345DSN5_9MOLU|nr:hypothetical protein SDAV_003029 [Spiroplasma phoeniceum P40]